MRIRRIFLFAVLMVGFMIQVNGQVVTEKKKQEQHKKNIESVDQHKAKKQKKKKDTSVQPASSWKASRTGKTQDTIIKNKQ